MTHSAAHINQLCQGDCYDDDDYYWEFRRITDAILAHYNTSAKSTASLDRVVQVLTGVKQARRFGTLHGIRWAEAMSRIIDAVFADLPAVVMDLNSEAKLLFKSESLTVLSGLRCSWSRSSIRSSMLVPA